jgi:ubiquinone/menaquinone biosynthesis C-methylase UbiE
MAAGLSESMRRMIPYRLRNLLRNGFKQPLLSRENDVETEMRQLKDILRREHGFIPPPPKSLQVRVIGLYSPHFIESGWQTFDVFDRALARAGCAIRSCETVLDFGCGCGRVIRAFHQMSPRARLYGSDIDAEAIQWLSENYRQFAHFGVNAGLPPLGYGDNAFDLIYSISVFTHLPESMQLAWLEELRRVSKQGGFVLATVHGEEQYSMLNASNRVAFEEKGFCYVGEKVSTTPGLPSFYQTTFHSHEYIRRVWSQYFEVVNIESLMVDGHSDLVILKKR